MLRSARSSRRNTIAWRRSRVRSGGFGERAADVLAQLGSTARVMQITLPDDYIEHGSVDLLRRETGTDTESIVRDITAAGLLLRRPANN